MLLVYVSNILDDQLIRNRSCLLIQIFEYAGRYMENLNGIVLDELQIAVTYLIDLYSG